jgi:hypothetical protein
LIEACSEQITLVGDAFNTIEFRRRNTSGCVAPAPQLDDSTPTDSKGGTALMAVGGSPADAGDFLSVGDCG